MQEEKRQEEIARQEKLRQEEREIRKADMAKQQEQWKAELDNQVKVVNDILEKNKVV